MTTTTTATEPVAIDFDRKLLHEMRSRAEGSGRTLSDFVNDAIRLAIEVEEAEDAADLAAFEETKDEPSRPFEEFVAEMRARGEL